MEWPILNHQTEATLNDRAAQLARNFTPEWRFDPANPDAGTALFMLFSRMLAGNMRRMNRIPERNYVSYLNLLGIGRIPATPATAYVQFTPVDGAPGPIIIQPGTRLIAPPAADLQEEILFATDNVLSVIPATLQVIIVAHGEQDMISIIDLDEQGALAQPLTLSRLDTDNLQSHDIYIEHSKLFLVVGPVRVTLTLTRETRQRLMEDTLEKMADARFMRWAYFTGEDWQSFDTVSLEDGCLVLDKLTVGAVAEAEVHGHSGIWIRGTVVPGKIHDFLEGIHPVNIDGVDIQTASLPMENSEGLVPDQMFTNDIEVENEGFHPFGTYFTMFNYFYMSQAEAFSKSGATISIQFTQQCLPMIYGQDNALGIRWRLIMRESEFKQHAIPELSVQEVLFEYWNGRGWVRLDVSSEATTMFAMTEEMRTTVTFLCPEDLEMIEVNGHRNYWIRMRIVRMDNNYAAYCIYQSPHLQNLRLRYHYPSQGRAPSHMLAYNNLEWKDVTRISGGMSSTEPWFVGMGRQGLQLIYGVSGRLEGGPVGIYLGIRNSTGKSPFSTVDWTYMNEAHGQRTWANLGTADDTGNFAKSGVVSFLFPSPVPELSWLGRDLHWMRCSLWLSKNETVGWSLGRAILNVASCTQRTQVQDELPLMNPVGMSWSATLMNQNILTESVWVDETGQLSSDEFRQLEEDRQLDVVRDANDEVMRVWVLWESVRNFSSSGPAHRHYVVDRVSGTIEFGDGQQGRVPPGVEPVVRVSYAHGGGKLGNVDMGRINATMTSIPFIKQILNPDSAFGGTDAETWEATLRRGPHRVAHRDRANTAEDWERLILESSSQVSRVKCFTNRNKWMEKAPGFVTVAVLTKDRNVDTFLTVRQRLLTRLQNSVPIVLTVGERLQVTAPAFIRISIHVHLVLERMDDIIQVETAIRSRLHQYFDIERGNHHGRGWQIGEMYHHSPLYGYLKSIPGVSYIERMNPTIILADGQTNRELMLDDLRDIHNGIVVSGTHQVSARIEMRRAGVDA